MISIRPASLSDVAAILELEQYAAGAAHWDAQEYSRILKNETAAPRFLLVAEQHSPESLHNGPTLESGNSKLRFVGFIVARAIGPEWEIENVAVAAQARRQHVGTQLVRAVLDLARRDRGTSVHLEVRASNAAARALYETCGFDHIGTRKDYYRDPDEDAVLYSVGVSLD
ncbi:MAG: ribosomal protein S18-alanine N-acetyltransferase [Acidobacteria bacterium]|nr:ribosomal protein S18-alanine N-acetyltransferase [Acidobacteriota bacterium]